LAIGWLVEKLTRSAIYRDYARLLYTTGMPIALRAVEHLAAVNGRRRQRKSAFNR
jgi:hypothetical protein